MVGKRASFPPAVLVMAVNQHFRIVAEYEIAFIIDPTTESAAGKSVVASDLWALSKGVAKSFEVGWAVDFSPENPPRTGGDHRYGSRFGRRKISRRIEKYQPIKV